MNSAASQEPPELAAFEHAAAAVLPALDAAVAASRRAGGLGEQALAALSAGDTEAAARLQAEYEQALVDAAAAEALAERCRQEYDQARKAVACLEVALGMFQAQKARQHWRETTN